MDKALMQSEIEHKFSKGSIREVVMGDLNLESEIYFNMVQDIEEYRNQVYSYESKNLRISKLQLSSEDLAKAVMIAIVPLDRDLVPIQSVVASLLGSLKYEDTIDGVKTAAELLAVCSGELYVFGRDSLGRLLVQPQYSVSDEVKKFIKDTKYLPPMICRPLEWNNLYDGGWLTKRKSNILKRINQHNENLTYDVVNYLQDIAWELNTDLLEFADESKKPLDTKEKMNNFSKWLEDSEEVYSDLLDQDNEFYFVWKRDSRGRMYSQGYHVNPQGKSYSKAIINFKTKTYITDEVIV